VVKSEFFLFWATRLPDFVVTFACFAPEDLCCFLPLAPPLSGFVTASLALAYFLPEG